MTQEQILELNKSQIRKVTQIPRLATAQILNFHLRHLATHVLSPPPVLPAEVCQTVAPGHLQSETAGGVREGGVQGVQGLAGQEVVHWILVYRIVANFKTEHFEPIY